MEGPKTSGLSISKARLRAPAQAFSFKLKLTPEYPSKRMTISQASTIALTAFNAAIMLGLGGVLFALHARRRKA